MAEADKAKKESKPKKPKAAKPASVAKTTKKASTKKTAAKKSPAKQASVGKATPKKAVAKKVAASGKPPSRTAGAPPAAQPKRFVSAEERWRMVAEVAYLRAEARHFAPGDEVGDWLAAEAEVDERLATKGIIVSG
jgi:hypothetical protein